MQSVKRLPEAWKNSSKLQVPIIFYVAAAAPRIVPSHPNTTIGNQVLIESNVFLNTDAILADLEDRFLTNFLHFTKQTQDFIG